MSFNSENPLLAPWKTEYELPPFDAIKVEHFKLAFEHALDEARAEIDEQAALIEEPTFANTIERMERGGRALSKISSTFYNLTGAHTSPEMQAVEREMAPVLADFYSSVMLNSALFARVDTLFQSRKTLDLTAEQLRVLERYHTMFVRSGAQLVGADRDRMAEISSRLAELGTQFMQNMLADEQSYELVLDEEDDLDGLPDSLIAAARGAARERGHKGKAVITLSRSLIEPFLQFSSRRDLREMAFQAWTTRGEHDGKHDNRPLIAEMLALRAEKANLLGFDSFAHFKLDDQMAKTPEAVRALLLDVWTPARAQALREADKLQALIAQEGGNFDLKPWDWRYYSEKVRQSAHDLDASVLKPYFPLEGMIEAAFDVAGRLFGLTFKRVEGLEPYHPDVRAYEVRKRDGGLVGLFLGDYFARSSKRSGAWMSAFRSQEKLNGDIKPIIVNVMNFAKADEGQESLLTFDDARTLFHEFGHALHGLMSDVTYPMISGTSVARDFVELPSQLYEHWLGEPQILKRYARHVETGEALPDELMDRLLAAERFNQGFQTVEYAACALVDLDLHMMDGDTIGDIGVRESAMLTELGMPTAITMRHRLPHFAHIFAGDGYSSGYYSYMWSEVMDADAFEAFKDVGNPFDTDIAARLAEHIYSAGGSRDAGELYLAFRGQMPSIEPLLANRGLDTSVPS